jgi:hypothetical protein
MAIHRPAATTQEEKEEEEDDDDDDDDDLDKSFHSKNQQPTDAETEPNVYAARGQQSYRGKRVG